METVNSFMTLIPSYQTTQHHIPQDRYLYVNYYGKTQI